MECQILHGDCRAVLPTLDAESVNCIVTSPPYYGLRDYGVAGQIGLESSPESYVAELVAVFRECRRVLRADGTCWLNLGDSYAGSGKSRGSGGMGYTSTKQKTNRGAYFQNNVPMVLDGFKPKDLVGIPWRVAFALQADGWYLRQDIIWAKPNPMPESVTDRCTKSHEYLFLITKSAKYWYDAAAIAEPAVYGDNGSTFDGERDAAVHDGIGKKRRKTVARGDFNGKTNDPPGREAFRAIKDTRNKRSVWTIPTQPCSMAHFAVMPEALVAPCILAGCPVGGTVLDPFGGSGTVGKVAEELGRNSILIELNPEYIELQKVRTAQQGLALCGA